MNALQEFGYEALGDGRWRVFGRVERMNEVTGVWETVADFTGANALLFPDGWPLLPAAMQEAFIAQFAGQALTQLAGMGG